MSTPFSFGTPGATRALRPRHQVGCLGAAAAAAGASSTPSFSFGNKSSTPATRSRRCSAKYRRRALWQLELYHDSTDTVHFGAKPASTTTATAATSGAPLFGGVSNTGSSGGLFGNASKPAQTGGLLVRQQLRLLQQISHLPRCLAAPRVLPQLLPQREASCWNKLWCYSGFDDTSKPLFPMPSTTTCRPLPGSSCETRPVWSCTGIIRRHASSVVKHLELPKPVLHRLLPAHPRRNPQLRRQPRFGGASQPSSTGPSLFGGASAAPAASGGLFGNKPASTEAPVSGGLFGAKSATPSTQPQRLAVYLAPLLLHLPPQPAPPQPLQLRGRSFWSVWRRR
ncbi:hypothetical protein MCOR02_002428 [Pyricularia oryzae]|nr:hypothetical protein MCOR02_002428 [Pyricularia oryzae]